MRRKKTWSAFFHHLHTSVCVFWSAVPGSIKNHLNTQELARITIASFAAGGGLFGLIQALTLQAGTVFPASGDAALATVILTMILEAQRRLKQGQGPSPHPVPPHPERRSSDPARAHPDKDRTVDRRDAGDVAPACGD